MNRSYFLLLFILVFVVVPGCGNTRNSQNWIAWKDPVVLQRGNAHVGPWKMNQSNWNYVDDPSLDLVGPDTGGLVWVNQGNKDVYFQRVSSRDQTVPPDPVNVSRTPQVFSWLPEVVVNPRSPENVYVLWQEIVFSGGSHGGEIFFARSTDGGRSFQPPINLSESRAGDGKGRLNPDRWDNGSLDLVLGPGEVLYAAWTEYEGRLWLSRSTNGGKSFTDPRLIAGESPEPPARSPSLAVGPGSDLYLAWTVGDQPGADIRVQSLTARGEPKGPPQINRTTGHSDVPKIALDSRGRVHVVYRESPGGPSGRYHLRYLQWKTKSREFTRPLKLRSPSDGTGGVHSPDLELSGRGNPYVLWEISSGRSSQPRALVLTGSDDGGSSFHEPLVVPGTGNSPGINGSLQGRLSEKLDLTPEGYLGLVNSRIERGRRSVIRLYRGRIREEAVNRD